MNIQNIQLNFSKTQVNKGWENNINYQKKSRIEQNDEFKENRMHNYQDMNQRKLLVAMRDKFNKKYREVKDSVYDILLFMRREEKQEYERVITILKDFDVRNTKNFILREQVISYLFEMASKYGYKRESLYLAITIYDKYTLINHEVDEDQVEEIATTCLFIAGKYIQYVPTKLKKIKLKSDMQSILKRQQQILFALNFNLTKFTAHSHLEYLLQLYNIQKLQSQFARFILDNCLFDYKLFALAKPEILAYGIIYIISQITQSQLNYFDCPYSKSSLFKCSNIIMKAFKSSFSKFHKLTIRFNPKIKLNPYYS